MTRQSLDNLFHWIRQRLDKDSEITTSQSCLSLHIPSCPWHTLQSPLLHLHHQIPSHLSTTATSHYRFLKIPLVARQTHRNCSRPSQHRIQHIIQEETKRARRQAHTQETSSFQKKNILLSLQLSDNLTRKTTGGSQNEKRIEQHKNAAVRKRRR